MPMLRSAFWLSIVYASILLHPRASADGVGADAAGAARAAGAMAATLAAVCADRAAACGETALVAARGNTAGLAALFAASAIPQAAVRTAPAAPEPVARGEPPAVPLPVPDPRRHARGPLLTGAP